MTVHGTNNSTPAVEAHGLGRRFGDLWVLQDVDLAAAEGTVLGLLGPNGAGKTTTIPHPHHPARARRRAGARWPGTTS